MSTRQKTMKKSCLYRHRVGFLGVAKLPQTQIHGRRHDHRREGCTKKAQSGRRGHCISSGGVHGVWSRHILLTRHEGLLRLEQRYWTNTRTFRSSNAASGALQPEFRTATSRLNNPAPWLSWTCSWSTASRVPGGFTCSRSSTATAAMPLGSGTSASSL